MNDTELDKIDNAVARWADADLTLGELHARLCDIDWDASRQAGRPLGDPVRRRRDEVLTRTLHILSEGTTADWSAEQFRVAMAPVVARARNRIRDRKARV